MSELEELLNFLLTMVELMALSPHSEKVLYLNLGPFCVEFIYSHCVSCSVDSLNIFT